MNALKFGFTRRWAGYIALAILFAAACAGLGMWQMARRAEAVTEIERVDANFDSTPIALADALPNLQAFDPAQKWLPVTVTGQYLVDEAMLVRNRPLQGPGFEQLVPLKLADGTVFIVDRGWLPTGNTQDLPEVIPAPPSGTVTVVARLKAGEPAIAGRGDVPGQIATIELAKIEGLLGLPTFTGAYGLMDSETPPATQERPVAVTRPVADEGPHLSYAFQWFTFGVLGFIGLGYIVRTEYRRLNEDDPEEQEREAARQSRRDRRGRSDADIEDEILDSHQ
ncbi:SURF1 family protein [Homoserinimonas sp. OAct 916]|uniref:SURF1 family cytochrome oxidase biogenesis protein n=1 Tax=Homoserinimonas sp. OAct 916 TaxID=2211450 RepID=UPI000DBE7C64|nr:SURF1 family protein [Homoserinimonas sp. OAct 916]